MPSLSFFKDLGKGLLKVVPTAAQFIPGIGPVAGAILNIAIPAIQNAATKDHLTGSGKKAEVLQTLQTAAPEIAKLLPSTANVDPVKFAQGADTLIEALLDLMKSTGDVPVKSESVEQIQTTIFPPTATNVVTGGTPPAGIYKVIGTLNITQ